MKHLKVGNDSSRAAYRHTHIIASQKQVRSSLKSSTASLISVQATTAHMWRVTEAVSVYGHGHHGSKGEGYVCSLYLAVSRLVRSGGRGLNGMTILKRYIADCYVDPTPSPTSIRIKSGRKLETS